MVQHDVIPARNRWANRLALGAALSVVVQLPGCAWFRILSRADEEPRAEPWSLQCFWVDRAPDESQPVGPRDHGTVLGEDPNGRRIVFSGGLEDGFLRVDHTDAWTVERGREPLGVDGSPMALERACRETLSRKQPGATVETERIAAVRPGEDVAVPIAFASAKPGPAPTRRLVVFGDSLSDPGNLKDRLKVFPATPYYLGRFSNGPNWADYFTERTRIPVYNHAVGGAISVEHPGVPTASILSAIQQGGQYLLTGSVNESVENYLELDLVAGQVQRQHDTVFLLWSGGNDYLSKEPISGEIETLLDAPAAEAGYRRVVAETVQGIGDTVRRLHAAGGRRFVVVNLPDLGRTPGVLHNESYRLDDEADAPRRASLSRKLSQLTRYHNEQLREEIRSLRKEFPGTPIVEIDAAAKFRMLLTQRSPVPGGRPFDYGFDRRALESREVRDRRGSIAIQDRCYEGGYLGTSDAADICIEENQTFFWDSVHPTSFTHCWLAFFVERELARGGLLDGEPDPWVHRDHCEARMRASRFPPG